MHVRAPQGMVTGGQTFFTRSPDLSFFFDDMRAVRPTAVMFPPRISTMMHDRFNEQLDRLPPADAPEGRAQQRKVGAPRSDPQCVRHARVSSTRPSLWLRTHWTGAPSQWHALHGLGQHVVGRMACHAKYLS